MFDEEDGHWETTDTADGWDTHYDTQVWVDKDGNRTNRTRKSYNSFYAKSFKEKYGF